MSYPTGGTITTSGAYRIHTFTSNGNFVVPWAKTGATLRVLIVGGGGGGGGSYHYDATGPGAGGGAGGQVRDLSSISLTRGTFSIVVGAGGGSSGTSNGYAGGSSSAFGYTSVGGGGGYHNTPTIAGTNYGKGGSISGSYSGGLRSDFYSGGGAGAGANGGTGGVGGRAGAGGVGVISNISGSSVNYGGGGGGGGAREYSSEWKGGYGALAYGGGNGDSWNGSINDPGAPNSGTANRGGGGGGCRAFEAGGLASGYNGGSGIVIIKYLIADVTQVYSGMI